MVSCLFCPQIQYELGGGGDENGVDEVQFEDPALAKETLRFICQLLDKQEVELEDTTSLCFCGGCAELFNSVMELYLDLSPLLEKIRKKVTSKFKARRSALLDSSWCQMGDDVEMNNQVTAKSDIQVEDMEMEQEQEDGDFCDSNNDEWLPDPLFDRVKSEPEDSDGEEEDTPKNKNKPLNVEDEDVGFQCHHCQKVLSMEPVLHSHISKIHDKTRLLWTIKYNCPYCSRYKTDDPNMWWAHILNNRRHAKKLKYCEKCDQLYLDDDDLFQAHTVLHAADLGDPVSCGICNATIPQASELRQHLLFHHSAAKETKLVSVSNEKICDVCQRCFKNARLLKEHAATHLDSKERKLKCEYCSKSFIKKFNLLMHLLEEHETDPSLEKKLKCSKQSCKKPFVSPQTLERHESFHKKYDKSGRTLKCEVCEWPFLPGEQEKLVKHVEDLHKKKRKVNFFTCTVVGCKFGENNVQRSNVKRHERKEHPHLLIHECQQCDMKYSEVNFLETHLQTHSDVGPFNCKVCGNRGKFDSGQALTHHLARHNGEETFKCDQCPETFLMASDIRAHKILKHDADSPFTCDKCDRKLSSMFDLKEHQDKFHPLEDSPKFLCSLCPRVFNTNIQLRGHVRGTHDEVCCEFCGFKGKRDGLKLHILRFHEREKLEIAKKFVCTFCGKKFLTNPELTVHRRTHTGEKPYVCHICQKGYTQGQCLTKHLRLHKADGTFFSEVLFATE